MINPNEIWQVEVKKQIFEANVEELCQWIAEGALLPTDKVRRGNLRWLEANKVPLLNQFFNCKELGLPLPVFRTSVTNASLPENDTQTNAENFAASPTGQENQSSAEIDYSAPEIPFSNSAPINSQTPNSCHFHPETEAKYLCETCSNFFCKVCPTTYGSSVKICPLCGALCKLIDDVQAKHKRDFQYQNHATEGFGFSDFGKALAYPFKFRASLIFGAVMFMLFTLGQTAWAVGGMFMLGSGIVCAMLANSLTFACLSNTIDNFSQGNLEADFMPGFDDFSTWDDVIHPFFLSIGAYLVSFAPLILIIVVSIFWMINSIKSSMTTFEDAAPKIETRSRVIEQMDRQAAERNRQTDAALNGNTALPNYAQAEEEEFKQVEEMINQHRQAQIESIAGKSPETARMEKDLLIKQFLGIGAFTLLFSFVAFLWGIFYFPAACAVAGYTRSFASVINPLVGLETIRRMGFNYVKILAMCLVLGILSFAASFFLELIFLPFDLPKVGNMPAKIIGGVFTFYFSVVFSVILGYALYKSSDRLNFYGG